MKKLLCLFVLALSMPLIAMEEDIVTLQSSDGQDFKIEAKAANQSETLKNLIEDAGVENAIPLPFINGRVLAPIIVFLNMLAQNQNVQFDWQNWQLSDQDLIDIINAINYLNIPKLFDPIVTECARRIFTQDLEILQNEISYKQYKEKFLNKIPKDIQSAIISRNAESLIPTSLFRHNIFRLNGEIISCAFNPNGTKLAAAWTTNQNNYIQIYDPEELRPITQINSANQSSSCAFSPDGKFIAVGLENGNIQIWQQKIVKKKISYTQKSLLNQEGTVIDVAFTPNNQCVTASDNGTVLLWDNYLAEKPQPVTTFSLQKNYYEKNKRISSFALSPDGRWIAVGSLNGIITIWENTISSNPQPIIQFEGKTKSKHKGVVSLAFSPDSSMILLGQIGATQLWRYKPGYPPELITVFEDERINVAHNIAFNFNGQLICINSGSQISIWKTEQIMSPKPICMLNQQPSTQITCVAFNPTHNQLVSGSWDGVIHLWRLPNFHEYFNKLDLVSAQIIAFIIKNNIQNLDQLTITLKNSLNDYIKNMLLGNPQPVEQEPVSKKQKSNND